MDANELPVTNGLVSTAVGDLPESDLDIQVIPQESNDQVWVLARECKYKGSNPALAKHLGEIVRRDVWATIKYGHAMTGEGTL
jgi:hypothetical protein